MRAAFALGGIETMLVEHRGRGPRIDASAWIAPTAVLSGDVVVGHGVRILYGAVLTAEGRQPLTVGRECVIMEQAVLRAAGRWPLELGDHVLVGPHAHLSGARSAQGVSSLPALWYSTARA